MRIFIVEDEEKLAKHLKDGLENEGFVVDYRVDGREGQEYIELNHENLDLIILDIILPTINGYEICKNIRDQHITVPVLMITAKDTIEDKVKGLDQGADDYIIKPFAFEELIARIKALLRRPRHSMPRELKIDNLIINTTAKKVFGNNRELKLTLKEFAILEYFLRHPNQLINREQILDNVWDMNFSSFSNVVDVHIKNLRKKLEEVGYGWILETVRGEGYRLKK